jgi:hypothetical protein
VGEESKSTQIRKFNRLYKTQHPITHTPIDMVINQNSQIFIFLPTSWCFL